MKQHWMVWNDADITLFTGTHAECLRFYRNAGGYKAGLHLGYEIY